MSLNGLDDAKVKEAYDAALAEPGRWFLLKYASRDEVQILSQGDGGIAEMRNSIASYEETSPLYGFLKYRRRNVIIKYMPEGCSRLIQGLSHSPIVHVAMAMTPYFDDIPIPLARYLCHGGLANTHPSVFPAVRVAVHYNAVCDQFAPYDNTLEITEAQELNDNKLSAASSLHTTAESTVSSTNSLRRRRLMEIAEEEEEEQREAKRQSTVEEGDQQTEITATQSRPQSPITGPPVTLDSDLAISPEASQFAGTAETPSFVGIPRPASPARSFDTETGRRLSSQSSRQDYYSTSSYTHGKPRVKLGPRPSHDPVGKQGSSVRPVASLPSSLKLSFKGGKKGHAKTPDDTSSIASVETSDNTFLAAPVPIPEDSVRLQPTGSYNNGRRPSSSSVHSVKSLPSTSASTKQNTITPEKLRLMKAMQLREKRKMASAQPPPVPSVEITADKEESKGAAEETEVQGVMPPLADKEVEDSVDQLSVHKAESGIDATSSVPTDNGSVHTQTDSASSEVGDSTKASSLSESTEETIHAQDQKEGLEKSAGAADTQQDVDAPTDDVPPAGTDNAENKESRANEVRDATQTEESESQDAQGGQEQGAGSVQGDLHAERSFIPTSKFAAEPQDGQAGVGMEPDPQDVTLVPGRIDEVDPASVETAERTQDGSAASPPKWNLPISKYSTHDSSKSLAPSHIPTIVTSSTDSLDGGNDLANAEDIMDAESASSDQRRSKRPEPIKTDLDLPEEQPTQQDEKPMDEPQSATVQDASSINLTSPVVATPPPLPSEPPTPRVVRTVSTPVRSPQFAPGDAPPSATRSVSTSAAFHQKMAQQASLAPRQPAKLATGISSRIKAFEQLAGKPGGPPAPPPAGKDRPSSAFYSVRNNSVRDGARSPSILERTSSISRGRSPADSLEASPSPETFVKPSRERSGSVASRLSVFESGPAPRGRPESISVTARIVREPGETFPRLPESQDEPALHSPLELKQSPLIIDHRKHIDAADAEPAPDASPVPTPLVHAGEPQSRTSLHERRLSKDVNALSQIVTEEAARDGHRPGQRTSMSMARDFIRDSMAGKDASGGSRPQSVHAHGSLMGRLSISSKRTPVGSDAATSPVAVLSPTSTGDMSESGDEKKSRDGNRASRFMRRLSSSLSPGRKQTTTAMSPTLAEENGADGERSPPTRVMTAPAASPTGTTNDAYMGDVNVQFPDTLLWKRRTVSVDSNGFLLLSAVQGVTSNREKQLKRYHLSEFKTPYTPEIEVQELPNSVCLDFVSGSGLQIAFQDRAAQLNGLHILVDAHSKHPAFTR
ncbi:hypothetical protein VMCG_00531 [Cytospora schulzeri]|uniref:ADF-H domain-containing protein n=1 Tax=Cytospora schulzeri TaxID=448051 RepID=A0A423X7Z6_9PEZI|nr:hypothetical protein VMCG_00531 [Valsa malicola]